MPNTATRPVPQSPAPREQLAPVLLHEFFDRSARRWPNNVAIDAPPGAGRERRTITYAELAHRTDALAARLRGVVTGESVVAILLPRNSEHIYLAQLAAMKAGAAYVCIEPTFPDAQVLDILSDSRPVALLTDAAGLERARRVGDAPAWALDVVSWGRFSTCHEERQVTNLPHEERQVTNLPHDEAPPWLTPRSLAYLIYTSGTTGHPKGVMIEHGAIANLIRGDLATFQLSPEDRLGQCSSCAYDSSVEEIWMALAAGATLVVMDDEVTHLGPDLVAWLRDERVTVFCPPPTLLRTTGCDEPENQLPLLRRIHVGGEPLTDDVASRWGRGRCLVNDYGPTECSVVALRAVIAPGDPITIGKPVPGIHAWVLNEKLEEVPVGETGELCLGGVGVARGYLNQPEMTAHKFPTHPKHGRIYRTGDLAHQDERGNFFCHGRIDSQVKVRGYRIELEAIETCLVGCPGVREAACTTRGEGAAKQIVAFIVAEDIDHPPAFDALKTSLRSALPEYMVPGWFAALSELPRSVSGKLDRRALPEVEAAPETGEIVAPRDEAEAKVATAFARALGLREVSVLHDFFHELGGDSLRAAQVISALRDDPTTAGLTVRDLYETRTAACLAARACPAVPPRPRPERAGGRPILATLAQTAWLLAGIFILGPVAYLIAFHALPEWLREVGVAPFVVLAPLLLYAAGAAYALASVAFAVGLKWLLIGRYRPRREPVWGGFYVCNWIVTRAVRGIPWGALDETIFQAVILRLLGAKIGKRVHIHRGANLLHGGWDLLEIGDDVTLGRDSAVRVVDYVDGQIIFAPVTIGSGCTLDIRAGVSGDAHMEPDSYLAEHSMLPAGATVPRGECWSGIPAIPAGRAPDSPDLPAGSEMPPWLHGAAVIGGRALLAASGAVPVVLLVLAAALITGADAASFAEWLMHPSLELGTALLGAALLVLSVPLSLVSRCLAMRTLGPVREGVISRWSWGYVRVQLKADLLDGATDWLSGTLMWRVWLRGAGMRVGPNSEFSTIYDTVPELVEVGADTFLADGIYLAGPRLHRGTVSLRRTRLGSNVFLGNYAVVPIGVDLPDGVLLGVCTVADPTHVRAGTSWFGNPPFELPKREIIEADPSLTHHPSRARYAQRVFWELLRFALPLPPTALALVCLFLLGMVDETSVWLRAFAVVPALEVGYLGGLTALLVALKWALLGRVRPGTHALWSSWCSRWDFHYTAWHHWGDTLAVLEGTLWVNAYLRVLGVKVGRGVVIADASGLVVDPDMLTLEDGSTVYCLFQAHTFEDRVLKIDRVRIGADASVEGAAVLLYGADIGDNAHVAAHSVVMKHERLRPHCAYVGHPTRPVRA